jgi:hypothetical protein
VLINHESSIGAFMLIALYIIYLVAILCISFIHALAEYQP